MRVDQLEQLAAHLARQATGDRLSIAGVLLIGSVALARPSADSDIDLAILLRGGDAEPRYERIDGVWVGYEFFDIEALRTLGDAPMLNQENLRNAARLAAGKILVNNDGDLTCILARLRTARPLVTETRHLFSIVSKCRVVASELAGLEQLRALQGMAFALSILALNLTPNRFQKPKWVLQDLTETGHWALIQLIDQLFPPSTLGGVSAQGMCYAARRATRLLFQLEGFPEPQYINSDHDLEYVYRTLLDAEGLLRAKRWKDAGLVATWSLRLGHRLAECRSRSWPPSELSELGALMDVNAPEITSAIGASALRIMASEARRLHVTYSLLYGLKL